MVEQLFRKEQVVSSILTVGSIFVAAQTGATSIQLAWSTNPESDITEYKVYYDTDQAGYPYANSVETNSTTTSYTISGLTTCTTYYIAVAAIDSDSNESWMTDNVSAVIN